MSDEDEWDVSDSEEIPIPQVKSASKWADEDAEEEVKAST